MMNRKDDIVQSRGNTYSRKKMRDVIRETDPATFQEIKASGMVHAQGIHLTEECTNFW